MKFPTNEIYWGHLDYINSTPDDEDSITVQLTNDETIMPISVSQELVADLQSMIGQPVTIAHIRGQWCCGINRRSA